MTPRVLEAADLSAQRRVPALLHRARSHVMRALCSRKAHPSRANLYARWSMSLKDFVPEALRTGKRTALYTTSMRCCAVHKASGTRAVGRLTEQLDALASTSAAV
jgi:hypothetical protein